MNFLLKGYFFKKFIFISVAFLLSSCGAMEQLTKPTAKTTPSEGPTIEQAIKEEYMGPKARVAVIRFEDRSAKGKITGAIGDGMAEMLANALFATNRFIVLERQYLDDVLKEQDIGASGRVRSETAARIGEIEGADLLIRGTITEFEPGSAGAGGAGGVAPGWGVLGGGLGIRTSHVALIITGIDARTSRRVFSEQVEGKARDISGLAGLAGVFGGGVGLGLAGVFAGFAKTPMEKAIRIAIEEAVKVIVAKTPSQYYRVPAVPTSGTTSVSPATEPPKATPQPIQQQPQAMSPPPQATSPAPEPPKATPQPLPQQQAATPPPQATSAPQSNVTAAEPEKRVTKVIWNSVNLREGPGTKYKVVGKLKKGASLLIIEEQEEWFFVRLENGKEGWVIKSATSESTKASK